MSEEAYEMLKQKAIIDYKLLEAELNGGTPVDSRDSLKKMRERAEGYIEKAQN